MSTWTPPHSGHGWEIEKSPWLWASMPVPSHRGQTRGEVPGFAPLPWQVGHGPVVGTETAIVSNAYFIAGAAVFVIGATWVASAILRMSDEQFAQGSV